MAKRDWVSRDELSAAELAVVDQNWAEANVELDRLLAWVREHRATGCTAWPCYGPATTQRVQSYPEEHLQMLLRAAIERLMSKGL